MKHKCSKCLKNLSVDKFHKDNANKSGLRNRCKACIKAYSNQSKSYYAPSPRVLTPTGKRLSTLFKQGLKECSSCKSVLTIDNFRKINKSKTYNAYEAKCRSCMKQYKKERHSKRNLDIREFLYDYRIKQGCYECGIKDPRVLEFDHLKDKDFNLGKAHVIAGITLKQVKAEVRKCVVRCSNCHKRKTHKEQDTWLNTMYEISNEAYELTS